ncbi:MAG: hypothetical protein F6K21_22535 [Symploca sp. SIO2D2]|nr:hypothetical protein [Symploca sp. SIO2D2]
MTHTQLLSYAPALDLVQLFLNLPVGIYHKQIFSTEICCQTQVSFKSVKAIAFSKGYCHDTAKNVGWVKRSETQKSLTDVGFRSSTQPTSIPSF